MDICGDNRFEIIAKAKADLLEGTNIETDEAEMAVLDNILFRCWQMGWLNEKRTCEFVECGICKFYHADIQLCEYGIPPCSKFERKAEGE